ncbi:MAG: GAF domain-containing protein [Devosia sp.]
MSIIELHRSREIAAALAAGPVELMAFVVSQAMAMPGVRTVTMLATAPDKSVTHRIGTSDTVAFPIGGFDPRTDDAWHRRIFGDKRAVIADNPSQLAEFIPEADQLVALGYGSTLCAPIIIAGEVRGVFCALGDAGILTPSLLAAVDTLLPIAALVFTFEGISER